MGLSTIFYERHASALAQRRQRRHVGHVPIKMSDDDGCWPTDQGLRQRHGRKRERGFVDIGIQGNRTYGVYRRAAIKTSVGDSYDPVAGGHTHGPQCQLQGIGSVGDRHAVFCPDITSKL